MLEETSLIIGNGFVGGKTADLLPLSISYDIVHCKTYSDQIENMIARSSNVFICIPTAFSKNRLDTESIDQYMSLCAKKRVCVRSTVNPGDCERWSQVVDDLVYWPEFMGETPGHPIQDPHARGTHLLGVGRSNGRWLIELLQYSTNARQRFRKLSYFEAEFAKLSENRAIAIRVMEFQELFYACERAGIDYDNIREAVYGDDPRFDLLWSFVGPLHSGLKTKCLPKDVLAWSAFVESTGLVPDLTRAALRLNESLQANS